MATAKMYGKTKQSLWNGEIKTSDTWKLMLTTASYTPDQDAHQYKSDVTNEVTATGYTAGGGTVTGPLTVTYDASTNTLVIDGPDVLWPASTITNARWGILYDSTPATDATRPLIGYVDFGGAISSVSATFSVIWDSTGMVRDSAA